MEADPVTPFFVLAPEGIPRRDEIGSLGVRRAITKPGPSPGSLGKDGGWPTERGHTVLRSGAARRDRTNQSFFEYSPLMKGAQ